MSNEVDIKENDIYAISPDLLHLLLKDHTMSTPDKQVNIFWATDSYASLGDGFQYNDQILCESITGDNGEVILDRIPKTLNINIKDLLMDNKNNSHDKRE